MKNTRNAIRLITYPLFAVVVGAWLGSGCANQVSLKSGNLAALKGSGMINVEYSYEGMTVGKRPEAEYIKIMMEKKEQKAPGSGAAWLTAWQNNRAARYQPKFEELLNKQMTARNIGLQFGNHPDAKYTLVLKTVGAKLGYQVGIAARPAFLDSDAIFCETQNRQNQVAVVTFRKVIGRDAMGFMWEQGWRVQEAYAKTGKMLGIRVAQKAK